MGGPGLRLALSLAGVRQGQDWSMPSEEVLTVLHGEAGATVSNAAAKRLLELGFALEDGLWLRQGVPDEAVLRSLMLL